jgi:hypothetical protein
MKVENYQILGTAVNQIHICEDIQNALNNFPVSCGMWGGW